VLDLAVLIPAIFITSRWLQQGRAWGYVLPGVLFVKVITIGLAVLGMIAWMITQGQPVELVMIAVFTLVTLTGIAVGFMYFRAIEEPNTNTG
jgi:D-alanyl-lipoteichoic acid acyltransferase DltB (MBOAT superfamily)